MYRRYRNPSGDIPRKYTSLAKAEIEAMLDGVYEKAAESFSKSAVRAMKRAGKALAGEFVPLIAQDLYDRARKVGKLPTPSPNDLLLVLYAFELIKRSKPLPYVYAAGERAPTARTLLTDVAFTTLGPKQVAGIPAKFDSPEDFTRAQKALLDMGLITVSRRGKTTKVSFNVQETPGDVIAKSVIDAAERVASKSEGSRDEARKILGIDGKKLPGAWEVDGKKIPKTKEIFVRSMDHTFDPDADCAAYWLDEAATISGSPEDYTREITDGIVDLLSDEDFMRDAADWATGGTKMAARKYDPFYVSLGVTEPVPGVPYKLLPGLDESMDLEARQAFISPFLLSMGFYYTIDDNSTRKPYCVANAKPLLDLVFKPALEHIIETGQALASDEISSMVGDPSARASAAAEAAKKARDARKKERTTRVPTRSKPEEPAVPREWIEATRKAVAAAKKIQEVTSVRLNPLSNAFKLLMETSGYNVEEAVDRIAGLEMLTENGVDALSSEIATDDSIVGDLLFGEDAMAEGALSIIFESNDPLFRQENVNLGDEFFDGSSATPTDRLAAAIVAVATNRHPTITESPEAAVSASKKAPSTPPTSADPLDALDDDDDTGGGEVIQVDLFDELSLI